MRKFGLLLAVVLVPAIVVLVVRMRLARLFW